MDPQGDVPSCGAPIPEEERTPWRRALEAALLGPALRRSARSREILTYLVGETLAGRRDRITGTTIAQDVRGRDASFDGEGDAIVRVQMRRLRMQLAEDYGAEALGTAPRIVVPKGAYRPELAPPPETARDPRPAPAGGFAGAPAPAPEPAPPPAEPRAAGSDAPDEAPRDRGARRERFLTIAVALLVLAVVVMQADELASLLGRGDPGFDVASGPPPAEPPASTSTPATYQHAAAAPPSPARYPKVAVLPFRNLTGDPANDVFRAGLQFQIASDLQRFGTIRAFGLDAPELRGGPLPARYYIGGTILDADGEVDVFVFLTDAETGRALLTRRIREPHAQTGEEGDYYTVLSRLSRAVSGQIAGEHGGIEQAEEVRAIADEALDDERGMEGFRCVALSQSFFRSRAVDDHRRALDCVDERLDEDPQDALLTAYKAMIVFHSLPDMGLMDTRALSWTPTPEEALSLASRAVSLDPGSDSAHAIRGAILNAFGEREEAIASLRRAAHLNPGNPTIFGLLALALTGDERWGEAREAAEQAIALSAMPQPFYYIPAFLGALMEGDRGEAMVAAAEVARTPAPWAPTVELIAADLAGEMRQVEALAPEVRAYAEEHDGDPLAGLRRWVPSERGMAELEARLAEWDL